LIFQQINPPHNFQDYIAVKDKAAKYLPHSAGRYQIKRFRKATCPIAERLASSLMAHGRNNGKKLMTVRIVKHAFEIIHLLTGEVSLLYLLNCNAKIFQNPVQVLVNAVINSGPREDSTRIGRAGTVRRQAVDVAPLRRVNQVRKWIWIYSIQFLGYLAHLHGRTRIGFPQHQDYRRVFGR
jgi:small subunit ribosomal protein S5e